MDINIEFVIKHPQVSSRSEGLLTIPFFESKRDAENNLSKIITNTIDSSNIHSLDLNEQTIKANLLGDGVRMFGARIKDRDIQIMSIEWIVTGKQSY